MDKLKNNHHRELHHKLTTGEMDPEDYHRKVEKFNREALRKMIRDNLKNTPKPFKSNS